MADGGDAVPFDQMQPIDQYILARTAELTGKITAAYAAFEFHRVYHLLNEFLNSELSAFYLDVLKDRLYTYPIAFKPGKPPLRPDLPSQEDLYRARRSAQTAIYKITDALARLTAPILSFTADEVYQSLPHTHGSVHLTLFPKPDDLANLESDEVKTLLADWDELLQRRTKVFVDLEALRNQKEIGKSLEATIVFYISERDDLRLVNKYLTSLPELFNVSEVSIIELPNNHPDSKIDWCVERSSKTKCDRCWRHVPDVGQQAKYPTVCLRCAEALDAIDFTPYAAQAES
jgi:isoleucyl-tRNA synthetase